MDLPAPASPVTSKNGNDWNSARICSANSEPNQKARAITPWVLKHVHNHLNHSSRYPEASGLISILMDFWRVLRRRPLNSK
ncbi:hypothetical protein D3C77_703760 [compost metagenome]